MKRFLLFTLVLCLIFPLSACTATGDMTDGLSVVVTTFPPYDFSRAVLGDGAALTMLLPPGSEAHTYDPTPGDIRKIRNADVFIYGGGESDAWMKDVLSTLDTSRTIVLSLTEIVPLLQAESDHDHGQNTPEYDEHVWTSPDNALLLMEAIRDAIITADPDNADRYRTAADEYMAEITALRDDFRSVVAAKKRDLLVFADRYPFLYLSQSLGLQYYSPFAGCAHETEPGAQDVAKLIDLVKAEAIPAVFYIEFSNRRLADAVAEATGCETLLFHSCHSVSREELEGGVTYVSLMRQNLENLRKALS